MKNGQKPLKSNRMPAGNTGQLINAGLLFGKVCSSYYLYFGLIVFGFEISTVQTLEIY